MSDDTTANGAALTEEVRELLEVHGSVLPDTELVEAVTEFLAARVAPLLAEVDALRGKVAAVRDDVTRLADSIDGDSGWEHDGGCEGEPDCFACIVLDLRQIAKRLDAPAAAQPERGLHPCEGCGLELDGDDPATRCDECADPQPDAGVRERDVLPLSRAEAIDLHWLLAVAINSGLPRGDMLNLAHGLSRRVADYTGGDTSTTDAWLARTGRAVESAATHPTTPHGSDQGERGRV